MTVKRIIKNRFGHFRAVWRILFYLMPTIVLMKAFNFLGESFFLIQGDDLSDYSLVLNRIIVKLLRLLAVLIPAVVLLRWVDKRPVALLGLGFYRESLKEFAIGMLLGLLMGIVTVAILLFAGLASFSFNGLSASLVVYLLCILITLFVSAIYEELLFRGYMFQSMIEGSNLWIALGACALLFGAGHIQNEEATIIYLIFTIAAGVLLGVLYYKTRALWICIGIHFMWNWTMAPLFGIGAGGHRFLRRTLFNYEPLESVASIDAETMSVVVQIIMMIGFTALFLFAKWAKPAEFNSRLWAKFDGQKETRAIAP